MDTTSLKEKPAADLEKEVCCPEFDPQLWRHARYDWENKLFLKDSIPEFFHIPSRKKYAKTITKMWQKAEESGAAPDRKHFLLLAHDPSPFKGELFMAVTKDIPGENVVALDGTFYTHVFEGPYNDVPRYIKEMNQYLSVLDKKANKYFVSYPYCPKCAEKYGHNYVVLFAKVN